VEGTKDRAELSAGTRYRAKKQPVYLFKYGGHGHRPGNIAIEPRSQNLFVITLHCIGRYSNYKQRREPLIIAYHLQKPISIDVWYREIKQDQIRGLLPDPAEGFLSIACFGNQMALLLEYNPQQFAVVGYIIDNEDPCHGGFYGKFVSVCQCCNDEKA
jgi:hypothetical protein